MAEKVFDVNEDKMRSQIKNLFVQGIENEELRIKGLEKLSREKQKCNGEISIRELVKYMQDKEESRKERKAENARYAKPNGETWYASTSTTSGISSASESNYPGNFQNLK